MPLPTYTRTQGPRQKTQQESTMVPTCYGVGHCHSPQQRVRDCLYPEQSPSLGARLDPLCQGQRRAIYSYSSPLLIVPEDLESHDFLSASRGKTKTNSESHHVL